MWAVLQVQMHIPIAAALAFSAGRVCGASLAYSAQPFRDIALFGIFEQVFMDLSLDLVGRLRFYEYHTVGYTTLWDLVSMVKSGENEDACEGVPRLWRSGWRGERPTNGKQKQVPRLRSG